jgi:hypothetical protein
MRDRSSGAARWVAPALILWLAAAAVHPETGRAQALVAHVERCIAWDVREERLQAVNKCKRPAALMFMLFKDQRVVEAEIKPGAVFDTGVSREDAESDWMYTACPAGHAPNVPFSMQYKDAIGPSTYQCVRRQLIRCRADGEQPA